MSDAGSGGAAAPGGRSAVPLGLAAALALLASPAAAGAGTLAASSTGPGGIRQDARPLSRARSLTSPDSLQVFLLTFGRGDRVWERFGHNALWIHDGPAGTDRVYNWGIFDFEEEDFLRRLLTGRMRYRLASFSLRGTLRQYRAADRSVFVQRLALGPERRRELQRNVRVNYRPGNRRYAYDPYRDNCSTRVRDHLDRVLGGRIRAATDSVSTGRTWRSHTLRLLRRDPLPYLGLAVGMGRPADRQVTAWQGMFLPLRLRARVRTLRVSGPEGGASRPLVSREDTLYLAARPPVPARAPDPTLPFLLASGGLTLLLAWIGRLGGSGRPWARRLFCGLAALWCALVGVAGTLMAAAWALTDHWILYRNENLLAAHPLFLVLAALLLLAARSDADPRRRRARLLSRGVAALAAAGVLLQLLPAFDQVNGPALALLLPLHLGVAAGTEAL